LCTPVDRGGREFGYCGVKWKRKSCLDRATIRVRVAQVSASAVICLDADQKNGAFAMFSAVLPQLKSPDGQRPELRKIDFTQKLARLMCLLELPEGIVARCTARPKPGKDICTLLPKEKLSLTGPEAGNWERSTSFDAE
jgi:hypothetical protein